MVETKKYPFFQSFDGGQTAEYCRTPRKRTKGKKRVKINILMLRQVWTGCQAIDDP